MYICIRMYNLAIRAGGCEQLKTFAWTRPPEPRPPSN